MATIDDGDGDLTAGRAPGAATQRPVAVGLPNHRAFSAKVC